MTSACVSRAASTAAPPRRAWLNVSFPTEQKFRGIHNTVAIDRSESTGFGQREMLVHSCSTTAAACPPSTTTSSR